MTAQQAVTRGDRIEQQPVDRQLWLLRSLVEVLIDDVRFCGLVDGVLDHFDEEDAKAKAAMEAELAAPPCGECGCHVGHSLTCPTPRARRAVRTLVDAGLGGSL